MFWEIESEGRLTWLERVESETGRFGRVCPVGVRVRVFLMRAYETSQPNWGIGGK